LQDRLGGKRGDSTRFFAFADTVAAKSYSRNDDTHGWMGIRFQARPGEEPSQILIHARLLDKESLSQVEVLGILGVNLVHGALTLHADTGELLTALHDGLSIERVEIDLIKATGPAFAAVDNRLLSLELVRRGLTNAAMISAEGEVVQPAEVLYKKPILLARGSFRPVTVTMEDMVECALGQFVQEPTVAGEGVVTLPEMTLNNLLDGGVIDTDDFLARADILGALGRPVLVSNYGQYWRLATYLFGFTKKPMALAMGVPTLRELFDEKYYADLPGGILESFGRMFENQVKVYAYPQRDPATGALITANNLVVPPHLTHLYQYLLDNRFIVSVRGFREDVLPIFARDVIGKIRAGDPSWAASVPPAVARIVRERGLWGAKAA
jgi:hypothetical protein